MTRARDSLEHQLAREPGLTRPEVVHRVGIHRADFDRAFGDAPAKQGAMQTVWGSRPPAPSSPCTRPRTIRTRGMLTPKDRLSDMASGRRDKPAMAQERGANSTDWRPGSGRIQSSAAAVTPPTRAIQMPPKPSLAMRRQSGECDRASAGGGRWTSGGYGLATPLRQSAIRCAATPMSSAAASISPAIDSSRVPSIAWTAAAPRAPASMRSLSAS